MYFDKWREEWGKKNIKEEDAIYEAYRYTKNKKKINEAFFKYTHQHGLQMLMNMHLIISGNKIHQIH